ncbi:MAG: s16: ribosomal protein bs16 [Verrucomicrobiaceae bacterium]|nr:s16: ribosomal protein bs16 [Verrucomicrobiaceae bacterium]
MSLVIRLRREGTKNRPFYRIVVLDSAKRRDGGFLESLGTYDPNLTQNTYKLDLPKVEGWLAKGARTSETVSSFIKKSRVAAK